MKLRFVQISWPILSAGIIVLSAATTSPKSPSKPLQPKKEITYANTIQPLFNKNCMPCHSSKGSGPFPLETYKQVQDRSELVRFQLLARLMPPVFTQSDFGNFSEGHTLSDQDLLSFQTWIQNGMKEGNEIPKSNDSNNLNPPASATTVIIPKNVPTVREEGTKYWMAIPIELPKNALNINSFHIIPDSPQAIRSITIGFKPEGIGNQLPYETFNSMDFPGEELIGTWAPGFRPWKLPHDSTLALPSRGTLYAQVLYSPTGKPESGGFKIIFESSPNPSKTKPKTISQSIENFQIQPGQSPTLTMETTTKKKATLFGFLPEARFYASRIKLTAIYSTGNTKTLFQANYWDPYWIGNYQFQNPVDLPAGTKLVSSFSYANDDKCAMNENQPPKLVTSGSKIDQEVCRMHIFLVENN